jgi:hypothetical protein
MKRKMSALQRKYFGKHHKTVAIAVHHVKRRKKNIMAKHKSYSRHTSRGIGGMKSLIAPIGAGVIDSYLDPMLPIDGVGATAMGMFFHNDVIKNIGLYKVGFSLGNIIPLPGRTATSGVLL